jgi:sugar (pentulose or hexulose) kinase
LWDTVIHLIKKTMGKAGVQASDICAMGVTTQRNTLILWDKCVQTFHDLPLLRFDTAVGLALTLPHARAERQESRSAISSPGRTPERPSTAAN